MSDDLGLEAAEAEADPDAFGASPVPNESQRTPEERMVLALAPPVPDGPDLDAYDEGNAAEYLEPWTIEDLDGASWAARKLRLADRALDERKRLYADQRARLDRWLEDEKRTLEADARFFRGRLEGFHRAAIAENPKAKTIRLPDGTELTSLAGKLAVEVRDLPALVEWCEANEKTDQLLRYPEPEPVKAEISKYSGKADAEPGEYSAFDDTTGEAIPGVVIVRKDRSYNVKQATEAEEK